MRFLILSLITLSLAACAGPEKTTPIEAGAQPSVSKKVFSQDYIDQLEAMCYAQIQRVVGETRAGRGIIWAECLDQHIRPVEKRNFPDKHREIDAMYALLLHDMKEFYKGHTTLDLLHERWARYQNIIGYEDIRSFRDSYI